MIEDRINNDIETIDIILQKIGNVYNEKKQVFSKLDKYSQWELYKMYEKELLNLKEVAKKLLMVKGLLTMAKKDEFYIDLMKELAEELKRVHPETAVELLNLLDLMEVN